MSRAKLVIGLADSQLGNQLWDELQWMSGTTNALTVGATTTNLGVSGGTVGFFGAAGATRQTLASSSNTTAIVAALANLGLVQ